MTITLIAALLAANTNQVIESSKFGKFTLVRNVKISEVDGKPVKEKGKSNIQIVISRTPIQFISSTEDKPITMSIIGQFIPNDSKLIGRGITVTDVKDLISVEYNTMDAMRVMKNWIGIPGPIKTSEFPIIKGVKVKIFKDTKGFISAAFYIDGMKFSGDELSLSDFVAATKESSVSYEWYGRDKSEK